MALVDGSSGELVALVGGLSSVRMDDYAVVGSYMRFGEQVRERLKDARLRIAEACAQPARRRDNHLLWAAPGSGKTYFVEQVAASLPEVGYAELNLAKLTEASFREGLTQVIAGGPTICLIDEVDAKPDEPWPYEALMPFLDVNLERGGGIVFVLAGSSGATIDEFKGRIRGRPKGTDVLSRVPEANGWEIAPMDAGDRILVALSQMLNAAADLDRSIAGVEKLALHYLAAAPHLANARQLREFAVRAVERASARSDRIRYDDLFDSGDPENKRYWASVMPHADALVNGFVHIHGVATSRAAHSSGRPNKPRAHLPVAATPFFGRESELAELLALLTREDVRLVTLTGPGGTGKTRLALEAASRAAERFADGVFFVGLAPLRELGAVRAAVAEAVGLGADADLGAWLASRRTLLVLDNLEHLRGVDEVVSELLVGATVVLATSRGPLRLSSERELPVQPLARGAAVELFVSRAEATGRQIAADETVGEICRRLDDLPLAIELAAARVRLLSPPALLQRLDEPLGLLTGGARDLPERQRTLRATIAWSHDLLTPDEQAAFRRLSIFRGSFTLEAAEAIAGADLDLVATLVEQSLVKPLGDDRVFLLETLREYARERLDGAGETDEYALRHARWYLERLEENHPEVRGPRHGEFMAWFAPEEDNLRAMLTVLSAADPSQAARAAVLLYRYWKARRRSGEAKQRLTELLEREGVSDRSRADLFGLLSDIEYIVGDLDASELAARASLRLTEPGSESHLYALAGLAMIAAARGEPDEAVRVGRDVLQGVEALDHQQRPAFRVDVAVVFAWAGAREEARATFVQASNEARLLGNPFLIALADGNTGWLDVLEERYEAAEAGFRSVLELDRSLSHARWEADTLRGLGVALLGLGKRAEARTALTSSLEILAADPTPGAELMATLLWIALATEPGGVRSAARLAGAVDAVRQKARLTNWPGESELRRRFQPRLIDALGEDEWAREQAAGATLTLEEAIELARTLAAAPPETTPHSA
jgi:predicted ATPase/Flp pilus assembly protein TadD